jgi:hypothetical protein
MTVAIEAFVMAKNQRRDGDAVLLCHVSSPAGPVDALCGWPLLTSTLEGPAVIGMVGQRLCATLARPPYHEKVIMRLLDIQKIKAPAG